MTRWIYRLALATCPADFRRRFAERMRNDLDELLASAPSVGARWRLVLRESADVVAAGWKARRYRSPARRESVGRPAWGGGPKTPSSKLPLRERAGLVADDIRFAARSLAARRGYTAISVLTLALGIGAGTIVFSVVDNVVVRPLPYADADRIVYLFAADLTRGPDSRLPTTPGDFLDWRERNTSFERLVAGRSRGLVIAGGSYMERVVVTEVSDGAFALLGISPVLGAPLSEDSDPTDVVLSHGAWQRLFGADPDVLGRTIRLGNESHTVVGVMPAGFRHPFSATAAMWRPLTLGPTAAADRSTRSLTVLAALKAGISEQQASDEMTGVAAALEADFPASKEGGVNVLGLKEIYLEDSRSMYLILAAAGVLVLLIACANVASLVLARGAARQTELAVRATLGAGRARLVRLFLAEGTMIAAGGMVLGVVIAVWGIAAILPLAPAWPLVLRESTLTLRGIAFATVATTTSLVLFSVLPALGMSFPRPGAALGRAAKAAGGSVDSLRFRRALVVAQVGLAIVLMVGASLLVRSVFNIVNADTGFDFRGVVSARVTTNLENRGADAYFDDLLERAAGLPGVTSAALVDAAPMDGRGDWVRVYVDGKRMQEERALGADYRRVSASYFETLSIERTAGRLFAEADSEGEPVAIINEDFARRFLPGRDPLGTAISVAPSMGLEATDQQREWRVIGVVKTVQEWGPTSFDIPIVYVPHAADPHASMSLLLRTEAPAQALIEPLRGIIREVGESPLDQVRTLASYFQETYETQRFLLALLAAFAGLAVMLALVGLYGVIAYHVVQRHREIGVRVALGADAPDIVRLFLRQGTGLALLAVVLGLAGAIPLARGLSSLSMGRLLVDMHWLDPVAFVAVPVLVLSTAVLASWLPSRRASRVDPVEVLRSEA